ncbi:alpha/beta fold hydrolase [Gordonia westfalica]|uniref:alpha/beta fold hydrolase n=1 Tax=Gordonia westfalica TaxID=158898 RepID=UPI000023171F|nr:alpha/beta fold hydrolase [Gordonia westfalica]CAE09068.1 putative epoxide hydrolase [Gordonia westfalica]
MHTFTSDSLTLQVTEHGSEDGEPIVLLHGFPQDSTSWTAVAEILAETGFRVLAPNLRGYSPGARPSGRAAYGSNQLVSDVVALLDAKGLDTAHVVGHDWGGALLWTLRKTHPHRIASATVISTPHPAALAWSFTHSTQALRSWYIAAIALPAVPELFLRHRLAQFIGSTGLPADRAQYYQNRMQEPGAATATLNWYRQMMIEQIRPPKRPVRAGKTGPPPTAYVWGSSDAFYTRAVAERTSHVVRDLTFSQEIEGGHWLPETHPSELAEAIRRQVESASSR